MNPPQLDAGEGLFVGESERKLSVILHDLREAVYQAILLFHSRLCDVRRRLTVRRCSSSVTLAVAKVNAFCDDFCRNALVAVLV